MTLRYSNFKLRARLLAGEEPEWLRKHIRRAYIRQVIFATVPWANLAEIRRLDRRAKEKSARTGRPYVLDHIIPITHKYVCGLNIPANIQVIPAATNALKSNHWTEHHGDFFTEPEQFSLWPENTLILKPPAVGGGGGAGAEVAGAGRP